MSFRRPRRSTLSRMTTTSAQTTDQARALLAAAQRGDEDAFGRLVEPHRARAARALLPHARIGARRRGRAAGGVAARLARAAGVRGAQLAALLALPHRDQRLPEHDRAPARAGAADELRPGRPIRTATNRRSPSPSGSSRTRTSSSVWRRLRGAGRALRAARERRAGVRRGAAAAPGAPARDPRHARGARLLGARGGGLAGYDGRLRQQLACSARARRSTSSCPSRASRRRCARSASASCGPSSGATWTRWSAPTSRPSSPC